jgi:hypothetical protein
LSAPAERGVSCALAPVVYEFAAIAQRVKQILTPFLCEFESAATRLALEAAMDCFACSVNLD